MPDTAEDVAQANLEPLHTNNGHRSNGEGEGLRIGSLEWAHDLKNKTELACNELKTKEEKQFQELAKKNEAELQVWNKLDNEIEALKAGSLPSVEKEKLKKLLHNYALARATQRQEEQEHRKQREQLVAAEARLQLLTYHLDLAQLYRQDLEVQQKARRFATEQQILIWISAFAILGFIGIGLFVTFGTIQTVERARGMITVFFGLGTVIIAFVLTLFSVLRTDVKPEERFKNGKDILTVFIGILGTIVGFYFGSTGSSESKSNDTGTAKGASAASTESKSNDAAGKQPPPVSKQ